MADGIQYSSSQEIVAVHDRVVYRIVDGLVADIPVYDRLAEVLTSQPVEPLALLMVVNHGTPNPPAHIRRYAAEKIDEFGERMVIVIALLGLGFWASALRTAAYSVSGVLGRGSFKLESSIEGAAACLGRELIGLDPAAIERRCDELRAHMVENEAGAGNR